MEKNLFDELDVMRYIQETFPQSEWRIQYMWNPFSLEYTSFGLVKKDQKTWNPFSDSEGLAKTLKETILNKFPNFMFNEEWNGKEYDQEFLLQFLISLGYEYSEDRKLRELMNPFSGEKIVLYYDENDEPYLMIDGKRQYTKKKTMRRFEAVGENGVEVKRFYIPIVIDAPCTKCGEVCKHDFAHDYMSYPTINKPELVGIFCEKCDEHFEVNVTLRMSLDVE